MKKEELVLLSLIRKSQFETTESIDFNDVDMNALYNEAVIQAVIGLVSAEIPADHLDKSWNDAHLQQIASYVRYCNAEKGLKNVLSNENIPFVILKGNAAAMNYNNPSLRKMGDIDFLVPQSMFSKTKSLLTNSGYVEDHGYERHIAYRKDGILFELHHHYSDDLDIEDYLIEGLNNYETANIVGHEFPILPKLANGLVLLDHMRRHLKSGLGLRQVIDWMMFVYKNLDDRYWENEFHSAALSKGMDILATTATRMCQLYLGLPETITWCKSADDSTCEELLNCLLISGNFGRKNGKGNSVETVSTNMKRKGLFRWLQHAGEFNWNAYHKHHWLKPFCWFYQIFRYAKQGIKTGRNKKQIKNDIDRSKERFKLLKKMGIE